MEQILILDFGSQYTQLIARHLRGNKVYCEILPRTASLDEIQDKNIKGVILSGGKAAPLALAGLDVPFLAFKPEDINKTAGVTKVKNFALKTCKCKPNWTPALMLKKSIDDIKKQVGKGNVICGLSGGVDSTVVAALINKAIGKNLYCIFVDTGLLRLDDRARIVTIAKKLKLNIKIADESKLFLSRLKDVSDPEKKRKIIGATFIEVFEREAKKFKHAKFLAQGTIYPDVIESISPTGVTVKSHHNVGGLPEKMDLKLVEPLYFLFKDEVRLLGKEAGLPDEILNLHPCPGPGLAVRLLGAVSKPDLDILREADFIVRSEIKAAGLEKKVWQAFAILLPVRTVGIKNEKRTYEKACAVRVVNSVDAMTAQWTEVPFKVLRKISSRIVSEVNGINKVVYDITSKPPSTIEWE